MKLDRDEIRKKLEKRSRKFNTIFAYRCALRVLPVLAAKGDFNYWPREKRKKYFFFVLRAIDFSEGAYTADSFAAYSAAYAYTFAASYAAEDAADAAAAAGENVAAGYAGYAAYYAAYAAADTNNAAANAAANAAIRSIKAYNIIDTSDKTIINQIVSDLDHSDEQTLFSQPLWNNTPEEWLKLSDQFKQVLIQIGFSYWADIYSQRITGKTDVEVLEKRLTLSKEILNQSPEEITHYLESLIKEGSKRTNEVKVVFLGDGGAGKTSLIKKIFDRDSPLVEKEPPTPGVDIRLWQPDDQELKAHLWDFGGQVIMHATHQFFMTQRSYYVIVLDGRKEQDPDYWLQHTKTFGGDSPVLVVINKIDQHDGDLERNTLKNKYPAIQGFYSLSCDNNQGIAEFIQALSDELHKPSCWTAEFPTTWFEVKEKLQASNDDYISIEAYQDICAEFKVENKATQASLLEYLNDLGIVVHFENLAHFNTQVLNPHWLTQAVYLIINASVLKAGKGVFAFSEIESILAQENSEYYYPRNKFAYIMEMMQEFELCYRLDQNKTTAKSRFLVPDLLDKDQPEPLPFDKTQALRFRFRFAFLPRAIITRFIVKMAKDIKDNCRWRYGLILENQSTEATALVIADNDQRVIDIWVKGHQARQYFAIIRDHFDKIFSSYTNFEYKELTPIAEEQGIFESYQRLLGMEQMGEDTYICGELQQRFDLQAILNGIEAPDIRKKKALQQTPIAQAFSPTINVDARSVHHHETNTHIDVVVNLDVKNQASLDFQGVFQILKEDAIEEIEDKGEQEKLKKELQRVEAAIEEVNTADNPEELSTSPAMKRLTSWVTKLDDTNSRIGKAIKKVEGGIDMANRLAKNYNKIADWTGMPQVPKALLKKE